MSTVRPGGATEGSRGCSEAWRARTPGFELTTSVAKGCALEGREKGPRISRLPRHSCETEGRWTEREYPIRLTFLAGSESSFVLVRPSPIRLPRMKHRKRWEHRREEFFRRVFSAVFLPLRCFILGRFGVGVGSVDGESERGWWGTPYAGGKLGELETRAPDGGLRCGRNGGVDVRGEGLSRALSGRNLRETSC